MALTHCQFCGHVVSTTAERCPSCGAPVEIVNEAEQEPTEDLSELFPTFGQGQEESTSGESTSVEECFEQEGSSSVKRWTVVILVLFFLGIGYMAYTYYSAVDKASTESTSDGPTCELYLNYGHCRFTGTLTDPAGTGKGKAEFDDGNSYEGDIKDGKMESDYAYFYYSNGDTYEGSFVDDHFSHGTYRVKETGEYFVGDFDSKGSPADGTWYDSKGKVLQ